MFEIPQNERESAKSSLFEYVTFGLAAMMDVIDWVTQQAAVGLRLARAPSPIGGIATMILTQRSKSSPVTAGIVDSWRSRSQFHVTLTHSDRQRIASGAPVRIENDKNRGMI
jgi:hypothetical protein